MKRNTLLILFILFKFNSLYAQKPCDSLWGYFQPFISVTKSGSSYTLHANTHGYTGLLFFWEFAPSATGPYSYASGALVDSTYTISGIRTTLYIKLDATCKGTGTHNYSCAIEIPATTSLSCDTPIISMPKSPLCPGDTLILNSSVSEACNLLQWEDSLLGDIAGAGYSYLKIPPPISSPKTYRLRFSCPYGTTYSSWFKVVPDTTCDTPKISISKIETCLGDTLILRATDFSPCSYLQWEDSIAGAISGAGSDSLLITAGTIRTSYRLKSTCVSGKTVYSNWVAYSPYPCDTPLVSISKTGGCSGDSLVLSAKGIAPCTTIEWEDSLSTSVFSSDSIVSLIAPFVRNAYRLKSTCASGSVIYSDWLPFTPYTTCNDSVWAGDINWDLNVDYLDLLYLGVAYGSVGYPRSSPSISWVAQYAKNWPAFYPSTVNYKHADCNGDGVVNMDDTLAIHTNYGAVHSIGIIVPEYATTSGLPDLYFDLSGLSPKAGDVIIVPIKLGSSATPMPLIYGIATQIYVDGIPSLASPMEINYDSCWISRPKYELDMAYSPGSNQLNTTYVRTDNNNTGGYGTIAVLTLQVPYTTPDKSMLRFNFLSAKMIDKWGNELSGFNILNDSIMVSAATGVSDKWRNGEWKPQIFPNPASGSFFIRASQTGNVQLSLFDLQGRMIHSENIKIGKDPVGVSLPFAKGSYLLLLKDENGNLYREKLLLQ